MDRIRSKYNPEVTQHRAEMLLKDISKADFDGWKSHPCTKYLETIIEAGLDDSVYAWASGQMTKSSIEETAMTVAKSTGFAEGLSRVLFEIKSMLENSHSEEKYEENLYNP